MNIKELGAKRISENSYLFSVFAPNANEVLLNLNSKSKAMELKNNIWQVETDAKEGDLYNFIIDEKEKFDPFAKSLDFDLNSYIIDSNYEFKNNKIPVSEDRKTLQVFMEFAEGENYIEKGKWIINKAKEDNFNEVLFLPVFHFNHIFNLGYHPLGFFAPESRYGAPQEFKSMVDNLHGEGISVGIDFVLWAHGWDKKGLLKFDGEDLFSFGDKKHSFFSGYVLDLNSNFVREYLKEVVSVWEKEYMIDFARVDGVNEILSSFKEGTAFINDIFSETNLILDLEFFNGKDAKEHGFQKGNSDGTMYQNCLLNYLKNETPHEFDTDFIRKEFNKQDKLYTVNHDLFLIGTDIIQKEKASQVKKISFISKLIYATKKSKLIFAHIDKYSEGLNNDLKSFFEKIDNIWDNNFKVTRKGMKIIAQHENTTISFDLDTEEIEFQ